ncbi:MAG TPA: hypothetical protein PLN91_08290 [Rhodanobacteraceae bacterium]|nr:hypothetical protein [Rhodanobacteraceae bacterium]
MPRSLVQRLCLLALAVLLGACGGGPVKRINPPIASIQQLTVRPDGSWELQLRIQNFSTVPMTFASVEAALELEDRPAGQVFARTALDIPGGAADTTTLRLSPTPAGSAALNAPGGTGVGYRLVGKITSSDPAKSFDLRYESRLSPVPGLPGSWR